MKKTTALILILALVSCLCIPTALAGGSESRPYAVYTALGDSIPAGYGPYNYKIKGFSRVEGSYPALVADAAADEFIPLGRTGFRTTELRYMLEKDYEGDEWLFRLSKFREDLEYYRNYFPESVSRSDLITVNVGSNDVLNFALAYCKDAITDESLLRQAENAINETLEQGGDALAAALKVIQLGEQAGEAGVLVAAFVSGMFQGMNAFASNWPRIMDDLETMAPDADIVAVGLYNPLKDTRLTDSSLIPIGRAFDVIVEQMNALILTDSAGRGQVRFVSTTDTEIYELPSLTDSTFTTQMVGFVHPTEAGHRSIACSILEALGINAEIPEPAEAPVPRYLETEEHRAFVSGYGDGTFRPDRTASRAEFASMLCALLQEEYRNGNPEAAFSDITGHWAEDQIRTIAALDLVSGYKDGTFRPDAAVTRGEAAAILCRLFDDPSDMDITFTDIAGHWAEPYVRKAAALGFVAGFADGTFRPDRAVTRAQLVTMLYAVLDRDVDLTNVVLQKDAVPYTDVTDVTCYYYLPVMEASYTHTYEMNRDKEVWTSVSVS